MRMKIRTTRAKTHKYSSWCCRVKRPFHSYKEQTQTYSTLWRPNLNLLPFFLTNNPLHACPDSAAVLYFPCKQVAVRRRVRLQCVISTLAIPWPAIWLDPQRGSVSIAFTFRWRLGLSAVPCCSCCSNVGRHGCLPGPLIHTPGGKTVQSYRLRHAPVRPLWPPPPHLPPSPTISSQFSPIRFNLQALLASEWNFPLAVCVRAR